MAWERRRRPRDAVERTASSACSSNALHAGDASGSGRLSLSSSPEAAILSQSHDAWIFAYNFEGSMPLP